MQKVKGPVPDRGNERGWGTEGPLSLLNVVLLEKLTDLYFFLSFYLHQLHNPTDSAIAAMHGPHSLVRSGYWARFGPFW